MNRILLGLTALCALMAGCLQTERNPNWCQEGAPCIDGRQCDTYRGACVGNDVDLLRLDGSGCPQGETWCYPRCSELATDAKNCGGCGVVCPQGNACVMGSCVLVCLNGLTDCSGKCVNTQSDSTNCGGCGKLCSDLPHGSPGCVNGTCTLGGCNIGWDSCDNNAANGCETDIASDNAHCGGCGKACPMGMFCVEGKCASSCAPPAEICGQKCVNTKTDIVNCGSCGNVCVDPPHAAGVCVGGTCVIGNCDVGYGNCDNNAANGCEVNTLNDLGHCGGCGKVCPAVANGVPACAGGTCTIGACNGGYVDCDVNVANGCEVDALNDNANCGGCGKVCLPGTTCSGGKCLINPPKADLGLPPPDLSMMMPQPNGAPCAVDPDCQSGHCYKLFCAVPTCGNGKQDGNESDKDCGGPVNECSPRCAVGKNCYAGGDCLSNKCVGTCQ